MGAIVHFPLVDLDGGFTQLCQEVSDESIEDGACALYCLYEDDKDHPEKREGGVKSIHGSLHVQLHQGVSSKSSKVMEYEATNGIEFTPDSNSNQDFVVSVPDRNLNDLFLRLPLRNFNMNEIMEGENTQIECIDISPDGDKYVAGGVDGLLWVGNLSDGKILVPLKGHVGDITCARFFPSGQVIVSASIDFSIRIFSALNGSNPRTLLGHTRSITNIQIIGKGKFIVSGAKDGCVRIWNVGSAECVKYFDLGSSTSISASASDQLGIVSLVCVNTSKYDNHEETEKIVSSSEYNIAFRGIVIFASLSDGSIVRISPLSSSSSVTTFLPSQTLTSSPSSSSASSPISSSNILDYDATNNILVVGSENGRVSLYADDNIKNTEDSVNEIIPARHLVSCKAPGAMSLHTVRIMSTSSLSTTTTAKQKNNLYVYAAAYDSHPYRLSIPESVLSKCKDTDNADDSNDSDISFQTLWFSGINYDPVHAMCLSPQISSVYLAATDGIIRKYRF